VVTGGAGPPLLLIHGWPQTWYGFARQSPTTAIGGLYDLGGIFSTYSTAC